MANSMDTDSDTRAPDIDTMRASVGRLPPNVVPPPGDDVDTLTVLLRGHIEVIIPDVQAAAVKLPKDEVPRCCALACVGEARGRVRERPGLAPGRAVTYASPGARTLTTLCDHEVLTGVRMCLACDQPIRDGEESLPYDHISPSGGAIRAGRVHGSCPGAVRRHW